MPPLPPKMIGAVMEHVWAALEATPAAVWLRNTPLGHTAVSALHVLGVALLVGSIVPLNLRRLGMFAAIPTEPLARVTVPVAGVGLVLALATGLVMFAAKASVYAVQPIYQFKFGLVLIGALGAVALQLRYGWFLQRANRSALTVHGAASLIVWLLALLLGRMALPAT